MTATERSSYKYVFDDYPYGGMRLRLRDMEIICRPAGALWIEQHAALIVADLHLEKGSSFARRGQLLPPYDTAETLSRLEAEVAHLSPRLIVFLGDTFHDAGGEERLDLSDRRRLEALALGRAMVWLVGNHDREVPRDLPGDTGDAFEIADLHLVHEPRETPRGVEIAGHLHPCAKVRGKAASIRRRCFLTDGERMILPAFGRLLRRHPLAAVLGRDRVHAIGWPSLEAD